MIPIELKIQRENIAQLKESASILWKAREIIISMHDGLHTDFTAKLAGEANIIEAKIRREMVEQQEMEELYRFVLEAVSPEPK